MSDGAVTGVLVVPGALYICTEDAFPSRRLHQLIRHQSILHPDVPQHLIGSLSFSDRIYVEHAADLVSLSAQAVILKDPKGS